MKHGVMYQFAKVSCVPGDAAQERRAQRSFDHRTRVGRLSRLIGESACAATVSRSSEQASRPSPPASGRSRVLVAVGVIAAAFPLLARITGPEAAAKNE